MMIFAKLLESEIQIAIGSGLVEASSLKEAKLNAVVVVAVIVAVVVCQVHRGHCSKHECSSCFLIFWARKEIHHFWATCHAVVAIIMEIREPVVITEEIRGVVAITVGVRVVGVRGETLNVGVRGPSCRVPHRQDSLCWGHRQYP